jgi:hypothetical protein
LIHPIVQAIETDPTAIVPVLGQSWLVGPGATNDWQDHDDRIAGWSGNGWLFIAPLALMRVYVESLDNFANYRGCWQLTETVASPDSGTVIDIEARMAIESILNALLEQGMLKSATCNGLW